MALFALIAFAMAAGCERDDPPAVDRNRPPETFVTLGPESSSNPDDPVDLYYRAHLFWRGEDVDGSVAGFRWAVDDTTDPSLWSFTTETDSIFRFEVSEIGAKEHLFLIRAVDNEGKQDATPDTLRFESFTTAAPFIDPNSVTVTAQMPTIGTVTGLASGDTVEIESDITVCWNGGDEDGFVVGWESKFDDEPSWTFHEIEDTCRTLETLSPGLHILSLRAVDDAGAKSSSINRVRIQSNYDPVSQLDLSTFTATLPRPWLGDTLRFGPGVAELDTLPLGATVATCWSSTDIDGPVVRYDLNLGGPNPNTTALCIDTDTTGTDPATGNPAPEVLRNTDAGSGLPFFVKGIDIYDNVEQRPDTVFFFVNFQPTVGPDPANPVPTNVTTGAPVEFWFAGDDRDSDPSLLSYRWFFSLDPSPTQATQLKPDSLFARRSFTPSEVGLHTLTVWSQDASGSTRESEPLVYSFRVDPPAGAGLAPAGAEGDPPVRGRPGGKP